MQPIQDDVLDAARQGSREAFAEIVGHYFRLAFTTALSIVQDTADAEDVVQDAFVRSWQRLAQCRDAAALGGWLRSVVRSVALNHIERERVRTAAPLGSDTPGGESPAADLERAMLRSRLTDAMGGLTPVQREVLLLYDLEGFRHAEIAELVGVSELMSRRHLSNARQRMRQFLSDPRERKVGE